VVDGGERLSALEIADDRRADGCGMRQRDAACGAGFEGTLYCCFGFVEGRLDLCRVIGECDPGPVDAVE
jgi:hypothetical protein